MKVVFNYSVRTLTLVTFLSLAACGKKEPGEKPATDETAAAVNVVSLTAKQYEEINIRLGSISPKNLSNVLKVSGFLKVPPQNKASITSAFGGTIQAILVQEGDPVQKGQTVATLSNPEFILLQQQFLETKAQLVFSEAEFNRQKELSGQNVSAQKTVQQAEANYQGLQAKLNALQQQLSLLNINTSQLTYSNIASSVAVKSPISGNISHIEINIGSNIQPSNVLMDVVDNSQLHLDLFVFEQDLPNVKVDQVVNFTLTNLAGKSYTAKIFSIGSAFENETKTIPVHASITGEKNGLIEGMNVTASIGIGDHEVAAVPSEALTSSGGNDYVFVLSGASPGPNEYRFERVQVRKGISDAGYTGITPLKTLPADARIVVNGSFYLMAMLTNTGEEE